MSLSTRPPPAAPSLASRLRHETALLVSLVAVGVLLLVPLPGAGSGTLALAVAAVGVYAVALVAAFAVVRHAEALAHLLGEPLGTLVLTLAVISIEVAVISATMVTSEPGGATTLARDTMYGVVMLALNGLAGASLLVGALRHSEQTHNLQGAAVYLALIAPLAVVTLVLPAFTRSTPGATFSGVQAVLLSVVSLALYATFLAVQNVRHRAYFQDPRDRGEDPHAPTGGTLYHGLLLVAYLVSIVVLSKQLSTPLDALIGALNAPKALVGFLVATLVFSPESATAVRAALSNRLQRSVNLLLGSVLATISLTVPAVLLIGLATGEEVVMGLKPADIVLLVLTLWLGTFTFSRARTNLVLGAAHLTLFLVYLMLLFEPA